MSINTSVQYNGGLLPDIIPLTQGWYHWGTRLKTMYQVVSFLPIHSGHQVRWTYQLGVIVKLPVYSTD